MMTSLFFCLNTRLKGFSLFAALLALGFSAKSAEREGIAEDSVLFGQSSALTGPARFLGKNMRAGILAAFEEANQKGGAHGRKLKLISLDDSYEPELAIKNTRALINKRKVFALIGAVGTPTSKAAAPIASESSVPYIAPFTGAEFLRAPGQKNVINIRASYHQEIQSLVQRLLNDLNIQKISILYQEDSYGRTGLKGLKIALRGKNIKIASKGSYLRNTTAVKTALLEIMAGQPEAVLIVGAYRPAAEFIKLAETARFNPLFLSLSFLGTEALHKELAKSSASIVISQVVPFPFSPDSLLVKNYQKAIQKDFNFVSLEGYLAGKLALMALQKAGRRLTRSKFLKAIRREKKISIDGFSLEYGPKDNQGSDKVFLTAISNGKLFPIDSLKDMPNEPK